MQNDSMTPSSGCNAPFLPQNNYPSNRGDIAGRFCITLTTDSQPTTCCLPCPLTSWTYSDAFYPQARTANIIALVSLICNTFLLATYALVPREKGHRHHLSIGLVVSLIFIAVAFVIPLGTRPDFCVDDITPDDFRTDASCGVTGVFVLVGAMGTVVWIFLRTIWTAIRIMTRFQRVDLFKKLSIGLGTGLPLLFLATCLPVTGVSYRLGNVCVPNHASALETWFVWILIFSGVSWIVQVITIIYCIWKFASSSFVSPQDAASTTTTSTSTTAESKTPLTSGRRKRIAWGKVRGVLALQWRTIVMSFIVCNLTIYFGVVFIQQNIANRAEFVTHDITSKDFEWVACLMANGGDKYQCLSEGTGLGLEESMAVGTLILGSAVGIFVFLLMVRWSMFVGWWQLLRNPRERFRRPSIDSQDLIMDRRAPVEAKSEEAVVEEREPRRESKSGDRIGVAV